MKRNLFILVLALQSAWVFYTVAVQERALREGTPILLETERVDPRDWLRGDYLILNYKISSVPKNQFAPAVGKDLPADGPGQHLVSADPRQRKPELLRIGRRGVGDRTQETRVAEHPVHGGRDRERCRRSRVQPAGLPDAGRGIIVALARTVAAERQAGGEQVRYRNARGVVRAPVGRRDDELDGQPHPGRR